MTKNRVFEQCPRLFIFFLVCCFTISVEALQSPFLAYAASSSSVTTKVITTPSTVFLTQQDYRWYNNVDNLTPTSPAAAEDTAVDTPSIGSIARLRMNIGDTSLQLGTGATFKIQYANATSGAWTDVASSTAWIFFDNPSVADGQLIVTTVLTSSTVGESYSESNPTASTPNAISPGNFGEWDWVLVNNSASTGSNWFFRMTYNSSTALDTYKNYPKLTAVVSIAPSPSPSPGPSQGAGGGTGYYFGTSTTPHRGLPVPPPLLPPRYQCEDFNGDNRVDMVDLSILLYYYHESGSAITRYDCNNDGVIDFTDVSILMFYWTGLVKPRPKYEIVAQEFEQSGEDTP